MENMKAYIAGLIEAKLDEAKVEINHSRYMRSHGKRAKGTGMWAFTTKSMGDPKDDEMTFITGELVDAGKKASAKLGSNIIYVMESAKGYTDSVVKIKGKEYYVRGETKNDMDLESVDKKTKMTISKETDPKEFASAKRQLSNM